MRVAQTADTFKVLAEPPATRYIFWSPGMASEPRLSPLFSWRGAIAGSTLPPTTRLVAFTLSLHMNERGGSAFPSVPTLGRESGLSENAVRDHLNALVKDGWLQREVGGGRRANTYTATTPPGRGGVAHAPPQDVGGTPPGGSPEDVKEDVAPSLKARARPRDEIYEALAVEFGSPATRNERSKRNGVVKQLKEAGATPAEIVDRRRRFEQRFPGATATDTTLMNHWGALAPNGGKPVVPPCPTCGVGQGLHTEDCERLHTALNVLPFVPGKEGAA